MKPEKCRVALIGYGGMAHWHGRLLKTMPDEFEVVGAYDIDPDACRRFEEDFGIPAYPSVEALWQDPRPEVCLVAVPNDLHRDLVIGTLEHGKAAVCEKPVTLSSGDLEEMIAASERTGCLFTVHQNRRWDEDYRTVRRICEENLLGKVFNVESRVHGSRGIPGDWRNTPEHGGGMIYDWGIHLFDQILMLTGGKKIVSVYCDLTHVTNDAVDDGFKALLRFEDGLRAHIEVGTSNFVELPRWYVQGENGTAVVEDWALHGRIVKVRDWENRDAVPVVTAAGLTKTMAPRTDETISEQPLPTVHADIHDYWRNIRDVLNGTATPFVTHEQLRRSMKLMEACFLSARENQVVKTSI